MSRVGVLIFIEYLGQFLYRHDRIQLHESMNAGAWRSRGPGTLLVCDTAAEILGVVVGSQEMAIRMCGFAITREGTSGLDLSTELVAKAKG